MIRFNLGSCDQKLFMLASTLAVRSHFPLTCFINTMKYRGLGEVGHFVCLFVCFFIFLSASSVVLQEHPSSSDYFLHSKKEFHLQLQNYFQILLCHLIITSDYHYSELISPIIMNFTSWTEWYSISVKIQVKHSSSISIT